MFFHIFEVTNWRARGKEIWKSIGTALIDVCICRPPGFLLITHKLGDKTKPQR